MHGKRRLALCVGIVEVGIIAALRIETTHGQEVEHLLVHFLFAVDQAVDHLFHVAVHGGHVEVEGHFGGCGRTGDKSEKETVGNQLNSVVRIMFKWEWTQR